ncbi:MAG TPA: hypothetical protein PKL31_15275 [Fulvivirga sp.]|nr:hypothetical protein [Fulvivirga sp.]
MKTLKLSAMFLMALFVFSCTGTTEHNEHSDDSPLELDNGQKWKVNAEMIPYILDGEKMLNEYDGSDYKQLAEQLKDKNNGLIKSCTMTGKSHDELHKWLYPHIELITALGDAESEQKATAIIEQLKESFNTYNAHFQ